VRQTRKGKSSSMKKFCLLLAALTLLTLCGCGTVSVAAPADSAVTNVFSAPPPERVFVRVITDSGIELESADSLPASSANYTGSADSVEALRPAVAAAEISPASPQSADPISQTSEPSSASELMTAPVEPETAADPEITRRKQAALKCIGGTTSDLYKAIGYPESNDYATSCLGPGQDGNLYYDGFTVYTYRENGTETVRHVE